MGAESLDRDPQAAIDMAAAAIATTVAGLAWRLRHPGLLEHPKVLTALRRLQDQVDEQLAYGDQDGGGRRWTPSIARDPPTGSTGLRKPLRRRPGRLSASAMESGVRRPGPTVGRARNANQIIMWISTMHSAMKSGSLPKFEVMKAIIIGCGGGEEDLKAFASAWRRIRGPAPADSAGRPIPSKRTRSGKPPAPGPGVTRGGRVNQGPFEVAMVNLAVPGRPCEGAAAQRPGDLGQRVDGEMGPVGQARRRARGAESDRVHARPAGGGQATGESSNTTHRGGAWLAAGGRRAR